MWEDDENKSSYAAVILPDGDSQVFIFPDGMEKFCEEHDAEVLHIYDDSVLFYSRQEKRWIHLDDDLGNRNKVTVLRGGKNPSTPSE